jgi:hypothetical protein
VFPLVALALRLFPPTSAVIGGFYRSL